MFESIKDTRANVLPKIVSMFKERFEIN